ncbi:MAG TPA: HD domain-containing protein [Roseiflexaceae bacterium]|nr:HD domain-containing protein [Roseiflexaceae bacterium]
MTDLVTAARAFAQEVHAGQERKAAPGVPYVAHLQDVFQRVQHAGGDEIVQAVAWLHDAPEDQGVQLAELGERFGPEVAATVAAVTEMKFDDHGRKRSWLDRKKDLLLGFDGLDQVVAHRAAQVFAADAAAACDDLAQGLATSNPADFWGRFNAPPTWIVAYQAARLEVVRRELGEQHPLAIELSGAYRRLLVAAGFVPEQVPSLFSLS